MSSSFRKIETSEVKNLVKDIIQSMCEETFIPDSWFAESVVDDVPLFNLLPRSLQISQLVRVLSSTMCRNTPPMRKNLLNDATYFAIFRFLKKKIDIEVDMSLIRFRGLGGVCYFEQKIRNVIREEVFDMMTKEESSLVRKCFGNDTTVRRHVKNWSENPEVYQKAQNILMKYKDQFCDRENLKERRAIRKSMRGRRKKKSKRRSDREDSQTASFSKIDEIKEFMKDLALPFKKPDSYTFDPQATEDDLEYAFLYRKKFLNAMIPLHRSAKHDRSSSSRNLFQAVKGIHNSHYLSYDLRFWDGLVTWLLVPYLVNPKFEDMKYLRGVLELVGSDGKTTPRFEYIRNYLTKEIIKFESKFDPIRMIRQYFQLKIFSNEFGVHMTKNSKTYSVASCFSNEGEDKEKRTKWDKLIEKYKGSKVRIYLRFHRQMIENNRSYDSLDDKFATLSELPDEDFMLEEKEGGGGGGKDDFIKGIVRKERIREEFGNKMMEFSALRCKSCGREETIFKLHKRCSACKGVRYCSRECQKKDWKRHKLECKKKSKKGKK